MEREYNITETALKGNIVADARINRSGIVARFTVAVDDEPGHTSFFPVVLYGADQINAAVNGLSDRGLSKGSLVALRGRFFQDQWEDADGNPVSALFFKAFSCIPWGEVD